MGDLAQTEPVIPGSPSAQPKGPLGMGATGITAATIQTVQTALYITSLLNALKQKEWQIEGFQTAAESTSKSQIQQGEDKKWSMWSQAFAALGTAAVGGITSGLSMYSTQSARNELNTFDLQTKRPAIGNLEQAMSPRSAGLGGEPPGIDADLLYKAKSNPSQLTLQEVGQIRDNATQEQKTGLLDIASTYKQNQTFEQKDLLNKMQNASSAWTGIRELGSSLSQAGGTIPAAKWEAAAALAQANSTLASAAQSGSQVELEAINQLIQAIQQLQKALEDAQTTIAQSQRG